MPFGLMSRSLSFPNFLLGGGELRLNFGRSPVQTEAEFGDSRSLAPL